MEIIQEKKKFPKVFIIVLNYNGRSVIRGCLSSLFKLEYPNFEVVVVDNDSKDGSLEIAKSDFSKATFIKNEKNLGFAMGNNIGIRFALERMAEYVLILNNDTEVEKDFLTKLVEAGESHAKSGIISPIILEGEKEKIWFSGGRIDWWRMKVRHERDPKTEDIYETDFVSGCAMLVKAEVFRKIGLLDEKYFLYWEDADFVWRARKAGFKNLVVSSSWVYHFEKSEETKANKIYWLVISGLLFFRDHTPFWRRPWIWFYVWMRKTKNYIDVFLFRKELAQVVRKAYQDFKNV